MGLQSPPAQQPFPESAQQNRVQAVAWILIEIKVTYVRVCVGVTVALAASVALTR